MKKLILVSLFLLGGCQDYQKEVAKIQVNNARQIIDKSTIECSDGNKVRVFANSISGGGAAFTVWNILDTKTGKPIPC